jgi:hypothetical protein
VPCEQQPKLIGKRIARRRRAAPETSERQRHQARLRHLPRAHSVLGQGRNFRIG